MNFLWLPETHHANTPIIKTIATLTLKEEEKILKTVPSRQPEITSIRWSKTAKNYKWKGHLEMSDKVHSQGKL